MEIYPFYMILEQRRGLSTLAVVYVDKYDMAMYLSY